jgi:lipopolysaccharide transport system ATP-binding protein
MPLSPDSVILVDGLHKKFCRSLRRSMYYGTLDVGRDMLGLNPDRCALRRDEFWALENVHVEVRRGEAIGIIGQNGSGKTTLLRMLNGIFLPDRGRVEVRGRIGALIGVGAGFHPHMTGRENIRLNGTIIGMSRQELADRFDAIVDFADIGDFLDAPIATYSSGMIVRLGFAIAIHSQPETMLADEALAVGDLQFILKCYRKISDYRRSGGSIILVSHSLQLVRNTCDRVLWLDKGVPVAIGPAQDVCDRYERFMMEKDSRRAGEAPAGAQIINNDPLVRITGVGFLDAGGQDAREHRWGRPLTVRIHFECRRRVADPIVTVSIFNPESIQVISNYTSFDGCRWPGIEGTGHVDCRLDAVALRPAEYKCSVTLSEHGDINNHLVWHDRAYAFVVESAGRTSYGIFDPLPTWRLVNAPIEPE